MAFRAMAMAFCTMAEATAAGGFIAEMASSRPEVARVVLKKGKAQIFVNGNPMVYSGAVDCTVGKPPPETGDAVLLTNGARDPIAWGVYNSTSMYRVRVMQNEDDAQRDPKSFLDMGKLIHSRLAAALELRKNLGFPSRKTNAYRLVNSEGDRLSGLVVDVFGDHAVVATTAAWAEIHKPTIQAVLDKLLGDVSITWRPSLELLKEEGLELKAAEGEEEKEPIQVVENGISFLVSLTGQKTGFYADQRESRLLFRSLCKHKSVLDLCCYTGGFALNAAKAGASHVIGIDSSRGAIDIAKCNVKLNGLSEESVQFEKADIVQYMREASKEGKSWNVVVLDPPKLAPNRKALEKATIKYRSLNTMAMQLTKPGGLLMTCSCSGAMAQSQGLLPVIEDAAKAAGRRIKVLRSAGAGPDHPLDPAYLEGSYLTNYLLQVQ